MSTKLHIDDWPVYPEAIEFLVRTVVDARPDLVRLDLQRQYAGRSVHAITIARGGGPQARPAILLTQPHAHEPAATVGLLHVLHELIFREDLRGQPTQLDVDAILDACDVTIIPDGNPDGRDRATCLRLDGTQLDNEGLRRQMRGDTPQTGEAWKRLDRWSTDEQDAPPDPVGIVYEQLDHRTWCEPNRCEQSSFLRLCHRLMAERDYRVWLDLHQTQMAGEDANCFVMMPVMQDELPATKRRTNAALAEYIHEAWDRLPYGRPRSAPSPFPYSGEQAAYFRSVWGAIQHRMIQLNIEVQMNSPRTSLPHQAQLEAEAARAALTWLSRHAPNDLKD